MIILVENIISVLKQQFDIDILLMLFEFFYLFVYTGEEVTHQIIMVNCFIQTEHFRRS